MADYDLGKARGKVVLDYESKGQKSALAELKQLDKDYKAAMRSAEKYNRELKQYEANASTASGSSRTLGRGFTNLGRDADKAKDNVNQLNRSLDRLPRRRHVKVDVEVDNANKNFQKFLVTVKSTTSALDSLTGTGIPDLKGGLGSLSSVAGNLAPKFKGLISAVLGVDAAFAALGLSTMKSVVTSSITLLKYVPALEIAMSALSLALAGASGYVVQLAADLYKVSGVFGVLPGVIGATLTVVGTLKLATAGMSDAFKELGTAIITGQLDAEKFTESIKNLTPSARKFITAIYDSLPALKEFRNIIQESFFAPFAASIKPVIDQYLPMLRDGMKSIATIAGTAINELLKFLQTPAAASAFQSFLNNTVEGFKILVQVLGPLAPAFTKIMQISSSFLPQLSQYVLELANKFASFIDKVASSGELQNFIQTGIDEFKRLVDVVVNFGAGFAKMLQIADANGGTLLQTLADLMSKFNEWVSSAEGKEALGNLFSSLAEAGKALGPVLQVITNALVNTLLPVIAKLGTATAPGQMSFFESLGVALGKLGDALVASAPAFNQLMTVMGQTLVDIMDKVGPELPGFFQAITDSLVALAPELPNIAKNLLELAKAMLTFDPQLISNVAKIVNGLVDLLGKLQTFKTWLTSWQPDAIVRIGEAFSQAWKNAQPFGDNLRNMLSGLPDYFSGIGSRLGEQLGGLGSKFSNTFSGIGDTLSQWKTNAINAFNGFMTFLGSLPQILWQKMKDAGASLWQGFKEGMMSIYNSLPAVIRKMVDKLVDWLPANSPAKKGPLSGQGWTYYRGQTLVRDFASGISSQGDLTQKSTLYVANRAASGLTGAGGAYLGDIKEVSDFTKHMIDLAGSIGDIIFNILQVAQTLSHGRLFPTPYYKKEGVKPKTIKRPTQEGAGKPEQFNATEVRDQNGNLLMTIPAGTTNYTEVRDRNGNVLAVVPPNATPAEAQRLQELRQQSQQPQQAVNQPATPNVGNIPNAVPVVNGHVVLPPNPSKEQVQAAIIQEGRLRGLSDNEIAGVLAVAQQESDFNRVGFMGFSTQTVDTGYTGGAAYANDYNKALQRFYDNYMAGGYGQGGGPQAKAAALQELSKGNAKPFLDWLQFGLQGIPNTQGLNASFGPNVARFYQDWQRRIPQGGPAAPGNQTVGRRTLKIPTSILKDEDNLRTQYNGQVASALIAQMFPEITHIGGARATGTAKGTHDIGRSIDISIPNWNTAAGKELGDKINDFLQANAKLLGIETTIWNNIGKNTTLGGRSGPPGSTFAEAGHLDHIDVKFVDSANFQGAQEVLFPGAELPQAPQAPGPRQVLRGTNIEVRDQNGNLLTTIPWNETRPTELRDQQGNLLGVVPPPPAPTLENATDDTANNTEESVSIQQETLDTLKNGLAQQDPYLNRLLEAAQGNYQLQQDEIAPALQYLDQQIADQNALNTPASKANVKALEDVKSTLTEAYGYEQGPDVLAQAAGLAQSAVGIAQDIFAIVDSVIESIGATKNIADILVRGVANTEDIYNMVDEFQKYIELAVRIGQLVTDSLSLAANITGMISAAGAAAGSSGFAPGAGGVQAVQAGLQTAAAISGIVTSIISAINTAIDIAQEAYRIGTKYLGRFLTQWIGLGGYQGRVKFLLDTMTGELKTWAAENPEQKTTFSTLDKMLGLQYPGRPSAPSNIFYIYQGPGQDPRDTMNDAMFAIKSSGTGVFGYGV